MSLFKSKQNSAAALPLPQPQTVIQQPQHWGRIVLVIFACAVLGILLGYFGVVALAADAGIRNPRQSVAQGLLWIVLGGGGLYCTSVAGSKVIDKFLSHQREIKLATIEANVKIAQYQLQASTTGAVGARALESDYAMARGCLAVLAKAYNINRPYTANESRPWVRDNAWRLISAAGIQGIKWGDCSGVKGWLEENGFVVGNQLNRVKYPHFEDARRAIDLIAAPPIKINQPAPYYEEKTSIIK